jgi:hypothetical protein
MPRRGFGSPSAPSGASASSRRDAGFGSAFIPEGADRADVRDFGFGSVRRGFLTDEETRVDTKTNPADANIGESWVPASQTEYSDEGGDRIAIQSIPFWPTKGPYRVRLKDSLGAYWPQDDVGCYSDRPGFGTACYTNGSRQFLFFILPHLPIDTFTIEVSWNNGTNKYTFTDAIRTLYRNEVREVEWLLVGLGGPLSRRS